MGSGLNIWHNLIEELIWIQEWNGGRGDFPCSVLACGIGLYYITSSDINRNVIANNSGTGIYINHATSTTIIENNVISGNDEYGGILCSSNPGLHTDPVIQHNVITNNNPQGVHLYGVDIEPQVLDNEISGNTAPGIQTYITEGGTFTEGRKRGQGEGSGVRLHKFTKW